VIAVAAVIASNLANQVSGDGNAEILRSTYENKSSVVVSGILQLIGFALVAAPLFFLFRADKARSDRVRSQLVGLVIVAPLFLAASAGLTIGARQEAADHFVAGEAKSTLTAKETKEKCASDLEDEGKKGFEEEYEPRSGETANAACERQKNEDDAAEHATSEASLAPLVSGLGLAGALGLIVALIYTSLWAMRTGLMTRFWGTLGMVSGVAFVLGPLFIVALVWLLYFAFLLLGRVPGGKPPAWAAGEAIPWPSPGEKMAAEMEPKDPGVIDVEAVEAEQEEELSHEEGMSPNGNGDGSEPPGGGGRRKRKRRD
jgi:hypothetical protein